MKSERTRRLIRDAQLSPSEMAAAAGITEDRIRSWIGSDGSLGWVRELRVRQRAWRRLRDETYAGAGLPKRCRVMAGLAPKEWAEHRRGCEMCTRLDEVASQLGPPPSGNLWQRGLDALGRPLRRIPFAGGLLGFLFTVLGLAPAFLFPFLGRRAPSLLLPGMAWAGAAGALLGAPIAASLALARPDAFVYGPTLIGFMAAPLVLVGVCGILGDSGRSLLAASAAGATAGAGLWGGGSIPSGGPAVLAGFCCLLLLALAFSAREATAVRALVDPSRPDPEGRFG